MIIKIQRIKDEEGVVEDDESAIYDCTNSPPDVRCKLIKIISGEWCDGFLQDLSIESIPCQTEHYKLLELTEDDKVELL
jgi:hypothetical protein